MERCDVYGCTMPANADIHLTGEDGVLSLRLCLVHAMLIEVMREEGVRPLTVTGLINLLCSTREEIAEGLSILHGTTPDEIMPALEIE